MTNLEHLVAQAGEYYVVLAPDSPLFPAKILPNGVNKSLLPAFRRDVLATVVEWVNYRHASDPLRFDRCRIEGYALVVIVDGNEETRFGIHPDNEGRYPIGAGFWDWSLGAPLSDADADRALLDDTARLVPQDGEKCVILDDLDDRPCPRFPARLGWDGTGNERQPCFRREVFEVVVAWINESARQIGPTVPIAYWAEGGGMPVFTPDVGRKRTLPEPLAYWHGDIAVIFNYLDAEMYREHGTRPYEPEEIGPEDDGRYAFWHRWPWELAD